jgi:alkylhydroperoxidase family enzyme
VTAVETRYDALISELREAAQPAGVAPEAMAAYLDKVRRDAPTVTDADVDALKSAGISEDEIFEQTVATAVAAGLARLDAGLSAL